MTDKPDDNDDGTALVTLDLPPDLVAQLERLRSQFGDEILIEMIRGVTATLEGQFAIRGWFSKKETL
jgi:hypothetical protein